MAWPQDHLPILKKNRQHIVENIDIVYSKLWDVLVRREVLSVVQSEKIQEIHSSDKEQVSALVTLLEKRPTYAFTEFLKALQETHHKDMVQFLADQMGYVFPGEDPERSKYPLAPGIVSHPSEQSRRTTVQQLDIAEGMGDLSVRSIKACTWEFYEHVKYRSYDLTGPVKGRVLIVSVSKNVMGWESDRNTMCDLFTDLGFAVEIIQDPNHLQLESGLVSFATSEKTKATKSVFVVMMAHGGIKKRQGSRPFIKLADDSIFYFKDQLDHFFSSEMAPCLIKKPKVFIIQACMGEALDQGTLVATFGNPVWQTQEFDGDNNQDKRDKTIIPRILDCLYAFATIPDYKAVLDTIEGSLFFKEINIVFREQAHDTHVSDMLVAVRSRVADKTGRMAAQRMAEEQLKEKTTGEKPERTKEVFVQTTHNVDLLSKRMYLFPGI